MNINPNEAPLEYFIEDFFIKNKNTQNNIRDKICRGNLTDEEYHHYCGVLKGVKLAEDNAKLTYKNSFEVIEKEDKEREFHEQEQKLN